MKFIIVGLLIILVIAIIVLAITFTREGAVIKSGAISNGMSYVKNNMWSTHASKINGYCRVDKKFTSTDLANFRVNSSNIGGEIFLILIQGDIEKKIEISKEFNKKIEMNAFEAGRIRLRLEFEQAKDLKVFITWA